MKLTSLRLMGAALTLAAACSAADLTYTENTQLTGGSMKGMVGFAARLGGTNLSKGMLSTVTVSGNKMAHRSGDTSTVYDLDAGTMTSIDYKNKKYSTITFQEMADAYAKMPQAMADARTDAKKEGVNTDTKIKVTANDKGAGPSIVGVNTKLMEVLVDSTTTFKDDKGQEGTMTTSMKMEQAMGKPQAWETVRDFYRRMSTKLAFRPNDSSQMMRQAGLSVEVMNEAGKKLGSLEGMPMRSVTQMIGQGQAGPQVEMPSAKDLAKGALGGLAGGLGGFGRKRKEEPKEEPKAAAAPAGPNVILEFTTEVTSLQPGVADATAFTVPAGFKQEENPMKKMADRAK
jgi:hypothetical protein